MLNLKLFTKGVGKREFANFVDNNEVTELRLRIIAAKVKIQAALTPREMAIFSAHTSKVEEIIKNHGEHSYSQS